MNFKRTSLVFLMLILFLNVFNILFHISPWWYLVPGLVLFGMAGLGSFRINMSFYFNVICRFRSKNQIVLSFDDGPHQTTTLKVLQVLKKHQAPATFFCIGNQVQRWPEITAKVHAEGHIIANHSYCHSNFYGFYSTKKIVHDLQKCNTIIKETIGVSPRFFRPPFGVTNPNMKRALRKFPLLSVGWSLRTLDTVNSTPEKLMKKLRKTKPGDIILFHDRVENIEQVLDEFLFFCKQQHLTIARLDEMINSPAYE
ncbi:MAG: polysaccharide deacetylase family protein [Bacteroidota bacterium]